MAELEFARQLLQEELADRFVTVFPEPPEGWRAEKAERQSGAMFGGGTFVQRTYLASAGEARIEAQIITGSPMIQAFAAMMASPAMMASEPGTRRVRIGRTHAVLTWDEATRGGDLRLVVGQTMIQLEGSELESGDVLVALAEKFDLRAVKERTGG